MANPFRAFRKNQKIMLVVLTLLAMVSFVILPIVMDMMGNTPSRDPVVVSTTRYGSLRESQLRVLRNDREILRGFFQHLAQSAMESGGDPRSLAQLARMIGPSGEENVVGTWLLAKRAEELGIMVSDSEINQFLTQVTTSQNISREAVQKIMQYRHISEDDLFRVIRQELLAVHLQQMFGVALRGVTPAQRWDYYRRLNEKARIEVAALPVASFIDKVADPSDATLREFFEQHKKQLYNPVSPEPGFRVPQKIAVDYFKANIDAIAVSDAEIQKYYDENKDKEFVQETLPEVKKETPAAEEEKKADEKPSTEAKLEPKAEAKPQAPKAEKPAQPEAKQPANEAKPAEKKNEAKEPAKKESVKDKTSAVGNASPFRLAAYQQEEKKDGKPAAQPSEPEKKATPKPADAEKAKETRAAPKSAEAEKKVEKTGEAKPAPAQPKHIPLDKVKTRIRANLAEAKIREIFGRLQDRMRRYHDELTLYEVHREDKGKKDSAKAPEKPDFKKLASENGLGFYTTPLISPLEVRSLDIGQSMVGQSQFLDYAFETLPQFRPETSQDIEGNHFLFWKTAQEAERIPEFDEKGMREQVLRAWKLVQARDLADKEAKNLAEEAGKASKPFKDLFAEKKITVRESEPFSWMTFGAFPAWFTQAMPEMGKIVATEIGEKGDQQVELVNMPGDDFMRKVFDLEKGKIGVAMNQPKTVVYVVRMVDLTPAVMQVFQAEDYSRYARVADQEMGAIGQAWMSSLRAEVGFEWQREPARDQRHYE
ncbi:MAG: hypothetical protein ABFD16_22190 [Thermoguttaceae bacterium]